MNHSFKIMSRHYGRGVIKSYGFDHAPIRFDHAPIKMISSYFLNCSLHRLLLKVWLIIENTFKTVIKHCKQLKVQER